MLFKFGEFKQEIDTTDFDFMNLFETKSIELSDAIDSDSKEGKSSEIVKRRCEMVFKYFDDLFGTEASNQMFGDKINMRLCDAAMLCLADTIEKDKQLYNKDLTQKLQKHGINRAQRRSKKK